MDKVKNITTKISRRLIIITFVGIFIAIFPLFIIGVEAQSPVPVGEDPFGLTYDPVNKRMYVTNIRDDTVSVIDTNTNKVIDTNPNTPQIDPIMVGVEPSGIAYDLKNKRMYVVNRPDHTVSVIDTTTNTVIDTNPNTPGINPITVGRFPINIAYDSENKERMYVTNRVDDTVSVIDTTTNTVIDTNPNKPGINPITVGELPSGIAYDPENKRMYVTNTAELTVSVIDTTTNTVVGNPITVGDNPEGIAYDNQSKKIYVTNRGDSTVSVIDTTTNTVVGNPIQVGVEPNGIAYDDPEKKRIYVTNSRDGNVSVIDTATNTVIGSIKVGDGPEGIAYDDPVNKRMYVTNRGDGNVSVIDTTTNKVIDTNPNTTDEIDPIRVGDGPTGIAYSQRNELMYVTNRNDGTVSVIDTNTNKVIDTKPNTPQIDPITVGEVPEGIAYAANQIKKIYVTNRGDGNVSVIDPVTNTVVGSIRVGDGMRDIAYDSGNERMYVTNPRDGTVSVIDTTTNTVIESINNVGDGLRGIAYDPVNKRMYVANAVDDTVSVIDTVTNTVIGSIRVGDGPEDIAYDPVNKRIYVTNIRDGTVSPINLWSDII